MLFRSQLNSEADHVLTKPCNAVGCTNDRGRITRRRNGLKCRFIQRPVGEVCVSAHAHRTKRVKHGFIPERRHIVTTKANFAQILIDKGYDEKYGARPLRRAVEHYLEDPLAEALLRGEVKDGEPCVVDRDGDKLVFRQRTPPAAPSSVST